MSAKHNDVLQQAEAALDDWERRNIEVPDAVDPLALAAVKFRKDADFNLSWVDGRADPGPHVGEGYVERRKSHASLLLRLAEACERACETPPTDSAKLPEAYCEPGCQRVWYGVDDAGKAWWRIDVIMDGATTASWAMLPEAHAAALAEARDLLREGCDLLSDEHETLKISITMADGTLSANPLDAWSVEKVEAMDDWIMRAGRASLSNDSTF